MSVQIQMRRDTAANWTTENPTLAAGEIGWESDTNQFKIGDGSTAWNSLDYYAPIGGSAARVKTADQNVTNTTLVDESGDLTIAIPAGETWVLDYKLLFTCASATPDVKVCATGTGTVTGTLAWDAFQTTVTGIDNVARRLFQASLGGTGATLGVVATATHLATPVMMRVTAAGGASGGTVKVQYAQANNDAVNVMKLVAGSSLMALRV